MRTPSAGTWTQGASRMSWRPALRPELIEQDGRRSANAYSTQLQFRTALQPLLRSTSLVFHSVPFISLGLIECQVRATYRDSEFETRSIQMTCDQVLIRAESSARRIPHAIASGADNFGFGYGCICGCT